MGEEEGLNATVLLLNCKHYLLQFKKRGKNHSISLETTTTENKGEDYIIIIKCTDCGNTFKKESIAQDEVVTCPVCNAQYKAVVTTDGKLRIEDFIIDENDFDEL